MYIIFYIVILKISLFKMMLFVRFDKFLNIFIVNLRNKKYRYNIMIKQHAQTYLISTEHNVDFLHEI